MAKPLLLKCRSAAGQHQIRDLDTESTLLELKAFILSLTGIAQDKILLKCGFPPTPINAGDTSLLKDCGIQNGDVIIVEELRSGHAVNGKSTSSLPSKRPARSSSSSDNTQYPKQAKEDHTIKRRVVPANNSCLFASINLCLKGHEDQSNTHSMRKVVADKILSDKEKYTEALLGRPPAAYADWIKKSESWGGGIELSILCEHFRVEIDVVDIQYTRVEKFGEDKFQNRILLIYDGIHYDPLLEDSPTRQRTLFPANDDAILARALLLAETEKSKRQYTDAKNFKLKCLVCGKALAGNTDAMQHAEETKHINFGEY